MSESLLLTPYFQTEVGIVFYRIPPTVSPADFGERTLLQPAPDTLCTATSGKIAKFSVNPTACSALSTLAKSPKVRNKWANKQMFKSNSPYVDWVKRIQTCQLRDGKYCHSQKTLVETENGAVQVCWHHDRLLNEGQIERQQLNMLADKNWERFISEKIKLDLAKPIDSEVTFADLVLWASLNEVVDVLNEEELRQFLKLPKALDPHKESTIGFEMPTPRNVLKQKIAPVLALKVDPEPLASFMAIPKLKRFENRKWLQFVKSQPCVCCGARADDPHHIIGQGGGKMGSKEHDLFTIPLCRIHHNELHRDVGRFEQQYGSQLVLLYQFLERAIGMEALVIDDQT